MTKQYILTWCCCTSFPAGELWHAVQPHWRWTDLPEGLRWSESQVWERRPGPPLLLCSRPDRTLPTAYTLWKGNSAHMFCIFSVTQSVHKEQLISCIWLPFCLLLSRFVMTPVILLSISPWTFWWKMESVKEWLLFAWRTDLFTASEPRILSLLPGKLLTDCLAKTEKNCASFIVHSSSQKHCLCKFIID